MLQRRLSASIWWVICENWLRNSFRNEQNVRQPQILTLLQHVYVAELKYLEHSQSGCACCGLITQLDIQILLQNYDTLCYQCIILVQFNLEFKNFFKKIFFSELNKINDSLHTDRLQIFNQKSSNCTKIKYRVVMHPTE